MKASREQDQRIDREFGRYRLAPPSPGLHDRVMRAAREALADSEADVLWTDRCLRACRAFQQEILAFASALMLILGVVTQLGGNQSVLANSIEQMKAMIAVSGRMHYAASMDCTALKPGAGDENSRFRIRWNAAGVTRVDIDTNDGTKQTLWISEGTVSIADYEGGPARSTAITAMPSKWRPFTEYLTPTILAQHMERYGLRQSERQSGAGLDDFLLVGQENQHVIEIAIDGRTYLPKTLKKYSPDSARIGKERNCLEEVQFQWNMPISPELLVPGMLTAKRQANQDTVQP